MFSAQRAVGSGKEQKIQRAMAELVAVPMEIGLPIALPIGLHSVLFINGSSIIAIIRPVSVLIIFFLGIQKIIGWICGKRDVDFRLPFDAARQTIKPKFPPKRCWRSEIKEHEERNYKSLLPDMGFPWFKSFTLSQVVTGRMWGGLA